MGWRGTGRTNPSLETKLSGVNGDRETKFFLVRLTKSRVGKRTRLIHTTMNVVIIHTHISSVTD